MYLTISVNYIYFDRKAPERGLVLFPHINGGITMDTETGMLKGNTLGRSLTQPVVFAVQYFVSDVTKPDRGDGYTDDQVVRAYLHSEKHFSVIISNALANRNVRYCKGTHSKFFTN